MMHNDPSVLGNPVIQRIINQLNKKTDSKTAIELSKRLDPDVLHNYIEIYFKINPQHAPNQNKSLFTKAWSAAKGAFDYSTGKASSKTIRDQLSKVKLLLSPNLLCGNQDKDYHGWGDWMLVIFNLGQMALQAQHEKSDLPIIRDMVDPESWRCKIYHSLRGIIVTALRETNKELYEETKKLYQQAYKSSVKTSAPGGYEGFDVLNITRLEDILLLQLAYLEDIDKIKLVSKTRLIDGLVRVTDANDSFPKCLTRDYAKNTFENYFQTKYAYTNFEVFISHIMVRDETKSTPQYVKPEVYRIRKKPSLELLLNKQKIVDGSKTDSAIDNPRTQTHDPKALSLVANSVFNRDAVSEEGEHSTFKNSDEFRENTYSVGSSISPSLSGSE